MNCDPRRPYCDPDLRAKKKSQPVMTAVLGTAWLALFCDYCLTTVAVPIFPVLQAGTFYTGVLFSSKALVQVAVTACFPHLADTVGATTLLISGLLIDILSSCVFNLRQDYSTWMVARSVQGAASAAIITGAFALLQRQFRGDDNARGIAMSLATTGIISGVVVGPPLGGLLWTFGPHVPYATMAALLSCALLCAIAVRCGESVPTNETRYATATEAVSVRALLSDARVLAPLGILLVANACIAALEATIGVFLTNTLEFTPARIGLIYCVNAVPSVIASACAGCLGNSLGRENVAITGCALLGLFMALGPKEDIRVEMVSLVGVGLGMGLVDGCVPAMLAALSDQFYNSTSVIYSLSTASIQIGFLLGGICGPYYMQHYGGFGPMSLVAGFLLLAYTPLLCYARSGDADLEADPQYNTSINVLVPGSPVLSYSQQRPQPLAMPPMPPQPLALSHAPEPLACAALPEHRVGCKVETPKTKEIREAKEEITELKRQLQNQVPGNSSTPLLP